MDSERREIKQLQFTAWPDHGVPDHSAPFLQFLRRVKNVNAPEAGPIIVHCSAGVGRTGCFIVIDAMIERLKYEKSVDIYGHVTCLRAQRNYMVQVRISLLIIRFDFCNSETECIMTGGIIFLTDGRPIHFHSRRCSRTCDLRRY